MKRRASVLVAVLWCVALLSVVVVGALYSTRMSLGAMSYVHNWKRFKAGLAAL